MKKKLAMLLIAALVLMLFQQVIPAATVNAADAEDPIFPTKDKFDDGTVVLNGDGAENSQKNYIGYDSNYGTHSTYLYFPLTAIEENKMLESVKLIIPIRYGSVSRTQSTVEPYVNLYGSTTDDWTEEGTTFDDLPDYDAGTDFLGKESFAFATYNDDNVKLEFDVTDFIEDQRGASDNEASFALTGPTVDDINDIFNPTGVKQNLISLDEQESEDVDRLLPYLEYVYVPNEPPTGTISINNGNSYTNSTTATLNLTASDPDNDAIEMQFSNDNSTWSTKEAFNTTKSWTLSAGDGSKTVYMRLSDTAGYVTNKNDTITLDTTAPVVSGVTHLQKTNQTVTISITEPNLQSAALNGSAFSSGQQVSAEGNYSLVVTDLSANVTTVNFSIDKTAPTISGVADGLFYNTSQSATYSDSNPSAVLSATLNGVSYSSGDIISAEQAHTLVVNDGYGNAQTVTFTIDTTDPTGSVSIEAGKSVTNKTNVALTVAFSDANAVQMRFSNTDIDWTGVSWISAASSHSWALTAGDGEKTVYMQLKDAAGNTVQYNDTITVNTVLPVVTGVSEGDKLNEDVIVSFDKGTAKLDGVTFTSGDTVSNEGAHTLVVTDEADNVATVNFSMDKTAPTVSGVTSGGLYNTTVAPSFDDNNAGETAELNGDAFISGSSVSAEGVYTLVVTDAYGNSVSVLFTVDKTAPVGSISILNNALLTDSVSVTLDVTGTDANSFNMQFSNDNATWSTEEAFAGSKTWTLSSGDGTKTVYVKLTDAAGNAAVFNDTIELDTTAPIVTGVSDGQVTNQNLLITFNEGDAALNGITFVSGTTVIEEREHTLIVTDDLGHETTVSFTIDKTAPIVTGVSNNLKTNQTVAISFNEGSATLNGSSFTSGDDVIDEGSYALIVTDAAGNVTTISFSIDKTNPTVSGVSDGAFYNTDRSLSYSDNNAGATATLNDVDFTNGTTVTSDGAYVLIVTDAFGNSTEVSFTIDKTLPEGSISILNGASKTDSTAVTLQIVGTDENSLTMQFSNDNATWSTEESFSSSKSWDIVSGDGTKTVYVKLKDAAGNTAVFSDTIELDTTAPILAGVTDGQVTNLDLLITFNEGTATLNGTEFISGTTVSEERAHTLIVTDDLEHETTISFTIDKTAPIVTGVSNNLKTNQTVTISFNEGSASLNGSTFTSGDGVIDEGSYTLIVTDDAGNVTNISFSIDKTLPTVGGVSDGEYYDSDQMPTFADSNPDATVSATLNGNPFISGSKVHEDGSYTLIVSDNYNNSVTVTFIIDQTAPVGSIVINDNDARTTDAEVQLAIESTDASTVEMRFSNDNTTWNDDWIEAAGAAAWMLSNGYGDKNVYVQLRDKAGNISTFSDMISYRSVPVVNESSIYGAEDVAYVFSGSDFDSSNADGKATDAINIVTLPANGKLQYEGTDVLVNDGIAIADISNLQFIPATNWFGETTFEWTATAESITSSASGAVTITIASVNDAPIADSLQFNTSSSKKIDGQLVASDVEQDSLTYTVVEQPAKGVLTLDSATGSFSYEPEKGNYGNVTFTYKANDGQSDSNLATVTIVNGRPSSGGGGGGNGGVIIPTIPDIKIEDLGEHPGVKTEVITKDGKEVLVVSLDGDQLKDLIEQTKDGEFTIDVGDLGDNVELEMDKNLLNQLDNGKVTLNLVVNGTGYGLSSSAIRDILGGWNDADAQLKIEIKQADQASTDKLEGLAEEKGYELLVTPMSYQLYFQTGDTRVNLTSVKGYITIAYGEEELKGKTPKTAVLLLSNGKLVHVPTKISNVDGQFEIKVHSFANGVFALIDFEKTFGDVGGWSKPYIDELASRLIVQGTGEDEFEPSRSVTRAEFAAIITGALGLYNEAGDSTFSDVSQDAWFASSLTSASDFGLISGYADGSFRPNEKISREEAMVILARAFSLMELEPSFTEAELDAGLATFEDSDELKDWSESAVGLTVKLGIVNGSDNQLSPSEPMTRAQLAAVIVKLLEEGQFI